MLRNRAYFLGQGVDVAPHRASKSFVSSNSLANYWRSTISPKLHFPNNVA